MHRDKTAFDAFVTWCKMTVSLKLGCVYHIPTHTNTHRNKHTHTHKTHTHINTKSKMSLELDFGLKYMHFVIVTLESRHIRLHLGHRKTLYHNFPIISPLSNGLTHCALRWRERRRKKLSNMTQTSKIDLQTQWVLGRCAQISILDFQVT